MANHTKPKFTTFQEFLDFKKKEDEKFAKSNLNKSLGKVTGLDDSLKRINKQADVTNEEMKGLQGYVDKVKDNARESASDKFFGDFVKTKVKTKMVGDKGDATRFKESKGMTTKDGLDNYKDIGKFDPDTDKISKANYEKNVENLGQKKADSIQKVGDRVAKRNIKKLRRQDLRARKLAKRRGMSPDQAKDFMANRRRRLGQFGKEYLQGLLGNEQNKANIDARYYRKDGSGTIQNQKVLDAEGKDTGRTVDATNPFKGKGLDLKGRGEAQRQVTEDYYSKILPKTDIKLPAYDFKKFIDPNKKTPQDEQQEIVEDKTKKKITEFVDPPKGPPTIEIPNVPSDTVNPTTSESIRARNRIPNSNFLYQGPTEKITDAKRYIRPGGSTFFTEFLKSITPTNTRRKGRRR
tara:strand:- start:254 stop:1474 length:1221 start_codon:yes stop_codon:yes gene_type:complete